MVLNDEKFAWYAAAVQRAEIFLYTFLFVLKLIKGTCTCAHPNVTTLIRYNIKYYYYSFVSTFKMDNQCVALYWWKIRMSA